MIVRPSGKRVASYERLSKDEAPDAAGIGPIQRQRDQIDKWAGDNGHTIGRRYCDLGGKRHEAESVKKRPQYVQLTADIKAGLWDVLVVEELTRLGFDGIRGIMKVCSFLSDHNVELVEAKSGKVINPDDDDIASYILALFAGHASKAEVANLGNRSLGRKVALGRIGAYQGHPVPIGMALQLRTESGLEKWTVETEDDGRLVQVYPDGREHWFEPGSKPGDRKKGELLFLVPTRRHPERLAWVRQAYEWYLAESVSMHAIAARLTNLGARTTAGGPLYSAGVQRLLEAQCFTGFACYGRRRQGRYSTIVDGLATPTPGDGRVILKPASEWVWSEAPVYEPPIISRDVWERTQQKIAAEKGGPRAPVNAAILLSGLPVCMGCGLKMVGHTSREKGRREAVFFGCSNYARFKARNPTGCGPGLVRQDKLLAILGDWMEQSGEALREAAGTADSGLLAPLHAERAGLRAALASVQRAVEDWLFDALGRVLPYEELPGGRRRFTFERHEEPDLVLTLPGCESPVGLRDVFGAASAAAARRSRERAAELDVEAGRMITAWHELPTASAKSIAGERLKAIEREQEELRSGVLDLQAQYKRIWAGLNDTATRLLRARREMAGDSDRRKALAIRGLVGRIECTFSQPELEREGGRRMVRRLVGVKVIPLGLDEEEGRIADERRPPRC